MDKFEKGITAVVINNKLYELGNWMGDLWFDYFCADDEEEEKEWIIDITVKRIKSDLAFPYNNNVFPLEGHKRLVEIAKKYNISQKTGEIKNKEVSKEILEVIQKYAGDEMEIIAKRPTNDAIIFDYAPEGFMKDLRKALKIK